MPVGFGGLDEGFGFGAARVEGCVGLFGGAVIFMLVSLSANLGLREWGRGWDEQAASASCCCLYRAPSAPFLSL